MGHSLGTLVVSALAVEHPELVRALVVVDPPYGLDGESAATLGEILTSLRGPQGYETGAGLFAQLEGSSLAPGLATWHRRRLLGMPQDVMAEAFAGLFASEDQFALRPVADDYLRRRTCPILAFHTDPEKAAWESRLVAAASPSESRVVTWERSGH